MKMEPDLLLLTLADPGIPDPDHRDPLLGLGRFLLLEPPGPPDLAHVLAGRRRKDTGEDLHHLHEEEKEKGEEGQEEEEAQVPLHVGEGDPHLDCCPLEADWRLDLAGQGEEALAAQESIAPEAQEEEEEEEEGLEEAQVPLREGDSGVDFDRDFCALEADWRLDLGGEHPEEDEEGEALAAQQSTVPEAQEEEGEEGQEEEEAQVPLHSAEGVDPHPDCCPLEADWRLDLAGQGEEALAAQHSTAPEAQEEEEGEAQLAVTGPLSPVDAQGFQLVAREEEWSPEEAFCRTQTPEEPPGQAPGPPRLVASPPETTESSLASPLWTQAGMEGCGPQSGQERRKRRRRRRSSSRSSSSSSSSPPSPRPLDFGGGTQLVMGDLFPPPPSSLGAPPPERGQGGRLAEEEGGPCSTEDLPHLRAVFEALDRDGDGFVRIEEFVQFATVYGAEQVKDLTGFLDPGGLGVISFEDFYRGIAAIRNGGEPDNQLCPMGYDAQDEAPSACPDEFDDFVAFEANEVTDSAYMGSESTYSECETFTDEDTGTLVHHEMHDDLETDSAIDSAVHSEFTDPIEEPETISHSHDLSLTSDINSHSIVTVITREEHFEDYGEGNEGDLFPDSLCNGESGFSSSSFLSPSPNKRLSSKKVARHLHQTGTLTTDAMEESFQNNSQCLEEDITDKVIFLEKRVTELEKDTAANGEQHSRLKQENLQLVHRANALEEQLKEQELKSDEVLMEEIRKQRELLSKMEREKSIEIENLQARLQQLDDENSELRSCVPCLKANIERLEEEKRKLLDEIEDLTTQLNEEQENKRKLGDKLSQERHQFQKDKESTQELIEDLRKQLEHLQLFKLEAEQRRGRSSSVGLQEYNSRTRETELEQEIRRLKQDNRNLKEQNDELNGQIINLSIQGAKNLFSASFSESLAAEISSVSRDELMEAIQKQEEINFRLQDYIDRIIVAIMETNPSILEVK